MRLDAWTEGRMQDVKIEATFGSPLETTTAGDALLNISVNLLTKGLGSVDIHLMARMVATRWIAARKLVSVLSYRVAIRRNSLIFWKKFSTRWRHL